MSEDRTTFRKVSVLHFLRGSAEDFVDLLRIRGITTVRVRVYILVYRDAYTFIYIIQSVVRRAGGLYSDIGEPGITTG